MEKPNFVWNTRTKRWSILIDSRIQGVYHTSDGKIQIEESECGKFNVIFIEQEDVAGCHTNAEYQNFKDEEF